MPELLLILRDIGAAILGALLGRAEARWSLTRVIRAPRDIVWSVASERNITFPGSPPIEIRELPSPRPGDVLVLEVRAGTVVYKSAYRQLERREGEGELLDLLPELSDPVLATSGITRTGYGLREVAGGTEMTTVHEGRNVPFMTRLNTPIGMRMMTRRIEAECLRRTGSQPGTGSPLPTSLLLAALSFAAAWYMFGPVEAALLMVILLLHELGHVAAMWLVGMPVKGVYFLPFLGAVALGQDKARSDLEHGFIALMGPFLSIAPTLALLGVYQSTGAPIAAAGAVMSAFLNLFNLLPIMPLDGGHVTRVALRAVHPAVARAVSWAGIALGLAIAFTTRSYLLGLVVALGALSLKASPAGEGESPPMSRRAALALGLAFVLAAGVYIWVLSFDIGGLGLGDLFAPEPAPRSPTR